MSFKCVFKRLKVKRILSKLEFNKIFELTAF